ncbi:chloride channel protein [Candidatus Saccharibacteria bacterium]|nr:chloride channel protein [Candidatus Saccharibacteria bacterium]
MKKVKLFLACVLVGILVALTYFLFEAVVRNSITFIWDTTFDTTNIRILVLPLCLVGALIFFGVQHMLDPNSENLEEHGLGGGLGEISVKKLGIVILVGYFSLVAGASLGPEAILVPSSIIIGALVGTRLFKSHNPGVRALAAAGIIALMAAFFHSFLIGVISVLLVTKQTKAKLSPALVLIAVLASASSVLTLRVIDPANKYFNFPDFTWKAALIDLVFGLMLLACGYMATFALKLSYTLFVNMRARAKRTLWWQQAILAGIGLGLLYLLGGSLVEFTGNESIEPLLMKASTLGIFGVAWVFAVKILVIGWSKAMGYRGGLVFPMIFVASTFVAMSQVINPEVNFGVGLIAAMVGVLAAEKKAKILF